MVDIHLLAHESEVLFLSIPLADVQRLTIHPFKWLHFVLFTICGTPGELYATRDGNLVDYHSAELGVDTTFYFKTLRYHFMLYVGLLLSILQGNLSSWTLTD